MDTDPVAADIAAQHAAASLKERIDHADADNNALLFTDARTHNGWLDKPVDEKTLLKLYELVKWAPTSANAQPARYVFLRSEAGKTRLKPHLSPGNIEKTVKAPVTVIVAHDLAFFDEMAKNFPMKDMSARYRSDPAAAELMALRNGTIQGAFLMLAARAVGLDVGAMSGFDHEGVDREFFEGSTLRSNFLCNLAKATPPNSSAACHATISTRPARSSNGCETGRLPPDHGKTLYRSIRIMANPNSHRQ